MGFKMKGPSMVQGSQRHTSALKTAMDDALAKGKAQMQMPSPAKAVTEKPKKVVTEKWEKAKTTKKANELGGYDSTTRQKGERTTYQPPSKTPAGDKAYAAKSPAGRKKQDDDWVKANTKKEPLERGSSSRTRGGKKAEKAPKLPVKPAKLPVSTKEPKLVKPTGKHQRKLERDEKRRKKEIERDKKRKYDVVEEKKLFKKRKIKHRESGRVIESGRSKFGEAVSKVTGRDNVKKARRPRKKRKKSCVGSFCEAATNKSIKTKMN